MKTVSLFAGCGGLDLGLINSGHKIVYATDIDEDCQKTYKRNIGNHFYLEDIFKLKSSDLPKFDVLIGGFPCQGFSVANIYRSKDDERNVLYKQIVRILKETTPKFFLAENVPGILSLAKGEVVNIIQSEFENIGKKVNGGYEVKRYLLNASNYGVPQNRKRVIFLGISNTFPKEVRDKMFACFPPPPITEKPLTLKDAIGDLPLKLSKSSRKYNNHYGTNHKVKINGYMGNRALSWDKPSPTIVGRGGGTGGAVIAVHPSLKRRFSVRETARIQTFPDDFIFEGAVGSQFRQIGNAVAVNFAYHMGLALKKIEKIENDYRKTIS